MNIITYIYNLLYLKYIYFKKIIPILYILFFVICVSHSSNSINKLSVNLTLLNFARVLYCVRHVITILFSFNFKECNYSFTACY